MTPCSIFKVLFGCFAWLLPSASKTFVLKRLNCTGIDRRQVNLNSGLWTIASLEPEIALPVRFVTKICIVRLNYKAWVVGESSRGKNRRSSHSPLRSPARTYIDRRRQNSTTKTLNREVEHTQKHQQPFSFLLRSKKGLEVFLLL
jgi:hypothetical protein